MVIVDPLAIAPNRFLPACQGSPRLRKTSSPFRSTNRFVGSRRVLAAGSNCWAFLSLPKKFSVHSTSLINRPGFLMAIGLSVPWYRSSRTSPDHNASPPLIMGDFPAFAMSRPIGADNPVNVAPNGRGAPGISLDPSLPSLTTSSFKLVTGRPVAVTVTLPNVSTAVGTIQSCPL